MKIEIQSHLDKRDNLNKLIDSAEAFMSVNGHLNIIVNLSYKQAELIYTASDPHGGSIAMHFSMAEEALEAELGDLEDEVTFISEDKDEKHKLGLIRFSTYDRGQWHWIFVEDHDILSQDLSSVGFKEKPVG